MISRLWQFLIIPHSSKTAEGPNGSGGAIGNIGNLTIANSTFNENTATLGGGAIVNALEGTSTISNTAFSLNSATGNGGAIHNGAGLVSISSSMFYLNHSTQGGAVYNKDEMSITQTNFMENTASRGGGIYCDPTGVLTVTTSSIVNNSSINDGGGIYNFGGATTLTRVTISDNFSANFGGGGVANTGSLNVADSTISNNSTTGYGGGGIVNGGLSAMLTIINSTIANNAATTPGSDGGGILNAGTATVNNSTISGNTAGQNGGGIYTNSDLHLENSILANSTSGGDCYNYSGDSIFINTNNLIEANGPSGHMCGIPSLNSDPILGPLANNGGYTQTLALLPGSPAIDMGDNATCETSDQRGISRPQGPHCDIGAYEYAENIPPLVLSVTRANTTPSPASSVDFTVTFSESVTGVDVTDFTLTTNVSDAAVSGVSGTGSIYTVTVSTGTTDGTIRLDAVDDNSIVDAVLNPLGGVGIGDGDFTGGEIYHTDKTAPIVISSMRVNSNPTNLADADFTVMFSESVTGVGTLAPFSDFSLIASPGITGAFVTGVTPISGTAYMVTVNTGSGNGTIRLTVVDDNSIVDAASNPLGGAGVGDGDFVSGDIYTIIKSATFIDVPLDYSVNSYIERLYNAGITGGCSLVPLMYCPENTVTRAQMAVFLLRGIHGSSYAPPAVGDWHRLCGCAHESSSGGVDQTTGGRRHHRRMQWW